MGAPGPGVERVPAGQAVAVVGGFGVVPLLMFSVKISKDDGFRGDGS